MTDDNAKLRRVTDPSVQPLPPDMDVPQDVRTKQERILDAALELFATRGYQATAVPEIARAANVATGTIYRYFDTKDDLLNALYQRWKGEFNRRVFGSDRSGPGMFGAGLASRDVFGMIWRRIMGWMCDCPQQAAFLDQHFHRPFLDETSLACERAYLDVFDRFVTDAVAKGQVRDMPPALVASLVMGTAARMASLDGDGYLILDDAAVTQAEASLWDAIRA